VPGRALRGGSTAAISARPALVPTPKMSSKPALGVAYAFLCLGILGIMPILASDRPPAYDGLTFTIWLTFWQIACALPLTVSELAHGRRRDAVPTLPPGRRGRTVLIAIGTGAMFGLSTYMYVVAAAKAGPVSMAIALQSYPLFAILLEALFLGKRKSPPELAFTAAIIVALFYLTTNGTFSLSQVSWWSVYALGIPLLWSVAHLLLRSVLTTTAITPNQVTISRLLISGAFLLAIYAVLGQPAGLSTGLFDIDFQKAAFLLGLAYYAELLFWFHAMRHIDVSLASSITVPAPALTMVFVVMFGGAAIETHQVLAMAVIAAALYGLLLAGRRKPTPRAAG
jgi:drug/metabolite transporter (DMT)-like permease